MGVQTLLEYKDELDGALQRGGITDTLKTKWVNQALREFGYAFKFHEMEGTVAFNTIIGQSPYTIGPGQVIDASNFRYVDEVWGVNPDSDSDYKIRPETRSRYRRKIGNINETGSYGTPEWYHKFGNQFLLRPIPDVAMNVTIDYYKTLTPFVLDTDVSPFHEDWDEVILVGALYRGFRHFGEFDRYQNVRNDFLGLIRSRQTEYDLEEFPEGGISPLGPDDTETQEST